MKTDGELEVNLFKQLEKILGGCEKIEETEKDQEIPIADRKGFLDPANVMMIIPKSKKLMTYMTDIMKLMPRDKTPELYYELFKEADLDVFRQSVTDETDITKLKENVLTFITKIRDSDITRPNASTYSCDYIEKVITIVKHAGSQKVKIFVKRDYPITVETDNLKFVLAPQVDSSD